MRFSKLSSWISEADFRRYLAAIRAMKSLLLLLITFSCFLESPPRSRVLRASFKFRTISAGDRGRLKSGIFFMSTWAERRPRNFIARAEWPAWPVPLASLELLMDWTYTKESKCHQNCQIAKLQSDMLWLKISEIQVNFGRNQSYKTMGQLIQISDQTINIEKSQEIDLTIILGLFCARF